MSEPPRQRHPMSLPVRDRDGKRRTSPSFFTHSESRDRALFQQMQTERTVRDAKIAKLRGLRLAREEADRQTEPPAEDDGKPAGKSVK